MKRIIFFILQSLNDEACFGNLYFDYKDFSNPGVFALSHSVNRLRVGEIMFGNSRDCFVLVLFTAFCESSKSLGYL